MGSFYAGMLNSISRRNGSFGPVFNDLHSDYVGHVTGPSVCIEPGAPNPAGGINRRIGVSQLRIGVSRRS